ncbi:MAG TPA: MFS transporter [Bacteroidales bacterium]|nr:MFS transporter [Bacteroidales bacterium]
MEQTQNLKKAPPAALRWIVLVFISLAMFGNYYIYDCISPLADVLKAQLHFTDKNIGLLQGIYSIPNIFMVLIGGIIIDRIGTKKAALIFAVLVFLGAMVTTLHGSILTMATGRLIFGLGAESMIVAITTILARWFKGKELSFAFGLNLTIARLGSFLALNSPTWGKAMFQYWQKPLWIAVGAGIIAVLTLAIYYLIDMYSVKRYVLSKEGNQDKIVLKDLIKFGKSFWFITLLCVTFYSAMFPFQTFAVKFFKEVHLTGLPDDVARGMGGFLSSLLTLSAMILTPLFGLLSDKIGKRSLLMMFGSLLIIPVYLIMAYSVRKVTLPPDVVSLFSSSGDNLGFVGWISYVGEMIATLFRYFPNIAIPMMMMGIAFSLIPAVMWPSVAIIVDQSKLGTAYGLMTMIQNIGLAAFNLIIGWANDFSSASAAHPQGYHLGMWIFSSLGFFGLIFAFLLRKNETGPKAHGLEYGTAFNKRP